MKGKGIRDNKQEFLFLKIYFIFVLLEPFFHTSLKQRSVFDGSWFILAGLVHTGLQVRWSCHGGSRPIWQQKLMGHLSCDKGQIDKLVKTQ